MSCICVARSLAMLLCLVIGSAAHAQSIDPASAQLALHQPFALRLLVRTETPLNSAHVAACIEADFQNGHAHLVADDMQITLTPAERAGWHEVLFRHPHVVEDRAVLARIVLRCPARFEREFVLEATLAAPAHHPRSATPTAHPARSSAAPLASRTPPTSAAPTKARPTAVTTAMHAASRPSTATVSTTRKAPDKAPGESEPSALQAEVTRLRQELAMARQPAPAHAVASSTAYDESSAWQQAAFLCLALPLLGLVPLVRRWRSATMPRIKTMDITQPVAPSPTNLPTASAPLAAVQTPKTIAPPAPAADLAPQATVDTKPAPTLPVASPIGELSLALIPPTVVPHGGASLADTGAAVFTCQVDQLVQDGYIGVAVNLLEKSLDAGPAKNPWLLLQLLALYERLGQRSEAARLISQLQTLYRVHLPTVGGLCVTGKSLLDQPDLLAQVSLAWQSPDVVQQLEDWLAGTTGPTWDLATFEDLLLLHAIAQNRSDDQPTAAPDPAPRFAHVLEWTTDDH